MAIWNIVAKSGKASEFASHTAFFMQRGWRRSHMPMMSAHTIAPAPARATWMVAGALIIPRPIPAPVPEMMSLATMWFKASGYILPNIAAMDAGESSISSLLTYVSAVSLWVVSVHRPRVGFEYSFSAPSPVRLTITPP